MAKLPNYFFNDSFEKNSSSFDDFHHSWMAVTVLSKLLLVAACYLVASLTLFEFKVNLKNRKQGKMKNMTFLQVDRCANIMRWLCLAASVLYLLQMIFELLEIHESHTSNSLCDKIRHIKTVLQCGAITCLYSVLWIRQRQFYRMPTFAYLCGKIIQFFSWSVVILMVVANIITITLYLSTRKYHRSFRGCILDQSTIWPKLPGVLLFIFATSFQIILVGLLIYPLLKHRINLSLAGSGKQMQQVKRVSLAALIAVSTTVVISVLSLTVFEKTHGSVDQIAHNFNILVTFFSILFSFNDSKARLFPVFVTNKKIVGTLKIRQAVADSGSEELSKTAVEN